MSSSPPANDMTAVATEAKRGATTVVPKPADHVIVLFGATGDLTRRKLLPGLFRLTQAGLMPRRFRIVGAARKELTEDEFRAFAREAVEEFGHKPVTSDAWEPFAARLSFVGIGEGLGPLADEVRAARRELGDAARVLHYLALPPSAVAHHIQALGELGLQDRARVVIEKPFGWDLESARSLNALIHSVFDESQVFRIDHFLGKEAVQNILAIRFANGMFEPVWNREHIDHIQIDVPETLSVGTRADYYDRAGAFRDMVVTHLFQILSFVAMEPPTSLQQKPLVAERTKVFDSMSPLRPDNVVRGQYEGYRQEEDVAPDSDTETFVAVRTHVDNWRWSGVPFFLRTGKRLAETHHLLTIAFRQPPRRMFPVDTRFMAESFGSDHLTFELGDPGSISTRFLAKVPGPTLQLGEADMSFSYSTAFGGPEQALEAYERLLHDVMIGESTLFTPSEGIERLWEVSEPVLESPPPLEPYAPGSWGPSSMERLIAPRHWHLPGHHV
jgi:glucose-6-phosphate 1-dehydrogenase